MKSYSLDYIDDLYVQYVRDPASVSENWRKYFEQFLVGSGSVSKGKPSSAGSGNAKALDSTGRPRRSSLVASSEFRIESTTWSVNTVFAGTWSPIWIPLGFDRPDSPELNPNVYGLNQERSESSFQRCLR